MLHHVVGIGITVGCSCLQIMSFNFGASYGKIVKRSPKALYCSRIHVLNLILTFILVFMVGAEMRHFWHVVLFGFIGLFPQTRTRALEVPM